MSKVLKQEAETLKNYGSGKLNDLRVHGKEIIEEVNTFKKKMMCQLELLLETDIKNMEKTKNKRNDNERNISNIKRRAENIRKLLEDMKIESRVTELMTETERQYNLIISQSCSLLSTMENDIGFMTTKPKMHVIEHIMEDK